MLDDIGKGTIKIKAKMNNKLFVITLTDVWYFPNILKNFYFLSAQDKCLNSAFNANFGEQSIVVSWSSGENRHLYH